MKNNQAESPYTSEREISKGGGFVVSLKIFDRKLQKNIVKWEKKSLKDVELLLEQLDGVLGKFK